MQHSDEGRYSRYYEENLPDVRDGLTRLERIILTELHRAQAEPWLHGRDVPTALLYGRVVEYIDVSEQEFQKALNHLVGT